MHADYNSPKTRSSLVIPNDSDLVTNQMSLASNQVPNAPGNETIITNQFLNKLAHTVGHDLRSPMFVVRSYAQLLKRNQDTDRLNRGLDMIEDASYQMENLIDGLVQLVDIYTHSVPENEHLDFQKVFDEVQLALCNEIEQFKPTFVVDFSAYAQTVIFPKVYLKEIMVNLIDNAMRHNADNRDLIIKINTKVSDGKLILNIIDNGKKKFTPREFEKLKNPYYSNCKDQSHTGLGLSKVEAIAQKVNSKFTIENPTDFEMMICKFVFP